MAVQLIQSPELFVRLYDTNISNFKVYAPEYINEDFAFNIKYLVGTTALSTDIVLSDNQGYAYFNPTEYLKSKYTRYIFPTQESGMIQSNTNIITNVNVNLGMQYGDPLVYYSGTSYTKYYYYGRETYENYNYTYNPLYWIMNSGGTGRFLSPVNEFYVSDDEPMWLNFIFFNPNATDTTLNIKVRFYDINDDLVSASQTAETFTNKSYYFLGCGPMNFSGITFPTGYSYYDFYFSIGAGEEEIVYSETIRIRIKNKCDKYGSKILYWTNSEGGVNQMKFFRKSRTIIKYNRSYFDKYLNPNYSTTSTFTNVRGRSQYSNEILQTELLTTDWLEDVETELLKSLLDSNDVYIIEPDDKQASGYRFIPCLITTNDFELKNNFNDGMYSYVIEVAYSNQQVNQSDNYIY